MAEKLQVKMACDVCGTSNIAFYKAVDWGPGHVLLKFVCDQLHWTSVQVRRHG